MFKLIKFIDKKLILATFFIKILVKICFLISPLLTQYLVDFAVNKDKENMVLFAFLSFLMYIFSQIIFYFDDIFIAKCNMYFYKTIFKKTYKNILNFDENKINMDTSVIYQKLGQDYEIINSFIFENPILIIVNIFYLLSILFLIFRYSFSIFLSSIILFPLFILFTKKYEKKFENLTKNWIDSLEKTKKYLNDVFNFRHLIRKRENEFKSISKIENEYENTFIKKYKFESFFNNFFSYSSLNFMILIVSIISCIEVFNGKLTVGVFFALSLYVSHLWTPLLFYVEVYTEFLAKKSIIDNFYKFLNPKYLNRNFDKIENLEIKNYLLMDKSLLNINFKKGEIYLILGDNGSGKTTLLTNIASLTNRYKGEIFINGKIKKDEYYDNIFFFDSKVFESEFFKEIDLTKKSMGEKKLHYLNILEKINADVYLIDEPTNYLKEENKKNVVNILNSLKKKEKIILVVTHDKFLIENENFIKIYM